MALQTIEQARVTFPVGSIPSRVVTRSAQNLFTVYNPRSTQILNVIPLSPDVRETKMIDLHMQFLSLENRHPRFRVWFSRRNSLHSNRENRWSGMKSSFLQMRTCGFVRLVCSYHCATQPSYLLNIFEVKEECLFTKLSCVMWVGIPFQCSWINRDKTDCFSSLYLRNTHENVAHSASFLLEPPMAKWVVSTNWACPSLLRFSQLYLVPGDHGLKYALLPDTPSALYSFYQVLSDSVSVQWLDVFQAYETYTTRSEIDNDRWTLNILSSLQGGARYLLAIGADLVARFYRLSISGHEIYLRELGLPVSELINEEISMIMLSVRFISMLHVLVQPWPIIVSL